jgi:hypothetical protein
MIQELGKNGLEISWFHSRSSAKDAIDLMSVGVGLI